MASGLVYQHMSSHYRRILNAKPVVDTSTPQTFKPRLTRSGKPRRRPGTLTVFQDGSFTAEDRNLIEADVCRLDWQKPPLKTNQFSNNRLRPMMDRGQIKRERGDLLERHNEQFEAYRLNFCPRILKTDAASKLRGMRVYHPPRRITAFTNTEWPKNSPGKEENLGQESSRDSAYNGGTSSTPDSQSPTCQQKPLPCRMKHIATQTEPKNEQVKPKSDDEAVYTKFIHDIVVEMTEKELCSNYALTKVMFRHYTSQLNSLDKDKMLQEIHKLREKLGMMEMNDDFESECESPTPYIAPPGPFVDPPSWTSVYKQLKECNQSSCTSSDIQDSINERIGSQSEIDKNDE